MGEIINLPVSIKTNKPLVVFGLMAWVYVCFWLAQFMIFPLVYLTDLIGVPLRSVNEALLQSILAAFVYVMTIALVIGVPKLVHKTKISLSELGLNRMPTWMDIGLAPAGFIIYLIISVVISMLAVAFLPWFDSNQAQDVGFAGLNFGYEYVLAFITLVIIAPVAEEVLFRGYLLGKLVKIVPIWVAILSTSLLFGFVHGAWNLAFDTFALSVILSMMRIRTGSLWTPILIHMTKNAIAFYILFINASLLVQ